MIKIINLISFFTHTLFYVNIKILRFHFFLNSSLTKDIKIIKIKKNNTKYLTVRIIIKQDFF